MRGKKMTEEQIREVVTRLVAELYWGTLSNDDWQAEFDEWCTGVAIVAEESPSVGDVSMHDFVDLVVDKVMK